MLLFLPLLEGAPLAADGRDRSVLSSGTFPPQALSQRCEKLRPLLFRLASEAVADEEALGKSQPRPGGSLQLGQGCALPWEGNARLLGTCGQSSPLSP